MKSGSTKPPRHADGGSIGALRLELRDIVKIYPGVRANDGVCLKVRPGEIHAVLGENGAGKSTLMKIIYGVTQPDAGRMLWNDQAVSIESPEQARKLGIAMVFQHFSLFETLTVAENVWLGLPETSQARVVERIREQAAKYGLALDPERPVHTLSVGEKQRVEIVRALLSQPQLLILDEPTSVLTPQAVDELFVTLRKLAQAGASILYISHKLEEIRALCHRCTVLRGGKVVGEVESPSAETAASLSRRMIGAEPPPLEHRPREPGAVVLEVRDLSLPKQHDFGVNLDGICLEVREGELLGIAGVSGSGQSELLSALSGEDRRSLPSSIQLSGRDVARSSTEQRRKWGLHFVPEERLGRATVPVHSLADNALLTRRSALPPGPLLRRRPLERLAQGLIDRFDIKARGPKSTARSLSGGNLQKYVVGRELDAAPKLLIVAQPTWGVDVGAAAQIRRALLELRDQGAALLVVSEELDELFELSDALVVMAAGRISPKIARRDATRGLIGQWMSGLWSHDAPSRAQDPPNPREDLAQVRA